MRILRQIAIVVVLSASPVALRGRTVVANDACAQSGTCCPMIFTVCALGPQVIYEFYPWGGGPCP